MNILLCAAQVAVCMLAHECGHVAVARFYGVRVKKIGFNWTGCYIRRERSTGWPEISVCLAGVAMNLALAIVFRHGWFAICNFSFAWVNLLPIANSDGSHALEALREMRWEKLVERVGSLGRL